MTEGTEDAKDEETSEIEKIDIANNCWDARRGVINPYSDFIAAWDKVIMLVLMWTAVVTPFEVTFLEPSFNYMFILNRVIDSIFLVDITMTFYIDPMENNDLKTNGLPDHGKIASNYLNGEPACNPS